MRSVTYRTEDLQRARLTLGFVGENKHTRFIFDCKRDFEDYPSAAPAMTVQPPDGEAYPAVITRDGDLVYWDVKDSDLIHEGDGELQLSFVEGEIVKKTYIPRTTILRSIIPTGEVPDPLDDFLTEASAALTAIPQAIIDALTEAQESGAFDGVGIQRVEKTGTSGLVDTYTITYTDGTTTTFTVTNGAKGDPGDDGISPSASVSKSGKVTTITVTDRNGTTTAQVLDGEDGTGGDIIDDTAGAGDTDKTFSADKLTSDKQALLNEINDKYEKPSTGIPKTDLASGVQNSLDAADSAYQKPQTGIPASDLASGVIPSVPVQDVQVNGTSVLSNGVANITIDPVETVSGTTPTIIGEAGKRYICGEVATLSITPPASGDMEVIFTSGSTPTVLTVPNTVKFPDWFDATSLEANRTYDMIITHGVYGVVTSWA